MVRRLLILLIPLLVVVFPAGRFLPAVYRYMVERRIYSLYGQLMILEAELERAGPGQAPHHLAAALEDLARRANHLSVPLGYSQQLFILKSHIAQARASVEQRREPASGPAP